MKSTGVNSAFLHLNPKPITHVPEPVSAPVPLFDNSFCLKSQKRTYPFSDFAKNPNGKHCEITRNAKSEPCSLKSVSVESKEELPVFHGQGFQVFLNDADAEIKDAGTVDSLMGSSCTCGEPTASNTACKNTDSFSKIVLNVSTDKLIENFDLFKVLVSRIQDESGGEEVNERNDYHTVRNTCKSAPMNCQNATTVVDRKQKLMVDRASQTENSNSRFFTVQNKGIFNLLGKASHRAGDITLNSRTKNRKRETRLSSGVDHIASTAESSKKWKHSTAQCENLGKNIDIYTSSSDGDTFEANNQADDYTYVILPDIEDLASSIDITPENKAVSIVNSSEINKNVLPTKIEQFEKRIRNSLKVLDMTDVTWEDHDMGTAAIDNSEQELFDWSTETAETESADEPSSSVIREMDSNVVDMDRNGTLMRNSNTTETLSAKRKRKRKRKFTSIKRKRQHIERKSVNIKQERKNRTTGHFNTRNHNHNISNDCIHGKHRREGVACRQTSQNGLKKILDVRQFCRRSRRLVGKVSKYQFCCKGYFAELPFKYKEPLRKSHTGQRINHLEDTVSKMYSARHPRRNQVKKGGEKTQTLSKSYENVHKVTDSGVNSFLKPIWNVPMDAEKCQSYHFQNSVPECNIEIKETVNGNLENYHVALKRRKNGKLFKTDLRKLRSKMILQRCREKNSKFITEIHANRAKEKKEEFEASTECIVSRNISKQCARKNVSFLAKNKNNRQFGFKNISKDCTKRNGGKIMQKASAQSFEGKVQTVAGSQEIGREVRNSIKSSLKRGKQKCTEGPLCEKIYCSPSIHFHRTSSKSINCCSKKRQLTPHSVGKQKSNTSEQKHIRTQSSQLLARKDYIQKAKAINKTRKKILCETQTKKQNMKTHPHSKMFKCRSCNYRTSYHWCLKRHEGVHLMAEPVHCKICQISFKSNMLLKQWHSKQRVNHSKGKLTQAENTGSSVERIRTEDCPRRSLLGGEMEVCSFKKDIKVLKTQTQVENIRLKNAKPSKTMTANQSNRSDELTDQTFFSKFLFSNRRIANKIEKPLNENKRAGNEKTNLDAVLLLDKIPVNIGSTVFVKGTKERMDMYKRNRTGEFTKTKSLPEEDSLLTKETLETESEEACSYEEELKPPDLSESFLVFEELANLVGQNDADQGKDMPNLSCAITETTDLNLSGNCYDGTDTSSRKEASTESAGHSGKAEGNNQNRNQPCSSNIGKSNKGGCSGGSEDRDKDDDNDKERKGNKVDSRDMELFTCLVCSTSYYQKSALLKHLSKIHRLINLCTLCYFQYSKIQRFSNPVTLRNHKLRAHQKDMVQCVCGTLLVDDKMLTTHLKKFRCNTTEDSKQKEMVRCVCGKRFDNKQMLSNHKMLKCRKRDCNQDISVRYNKKTDAMKNPDQSHCNTVDKTTVVAGPKEVPKVLSEITQIEIVDSATNENYIKVQRASRDAANGEHNDDLNNNNTATVSADTEINTDMTHPEEVHKNHLLQKYAFADQYTNRNMTLTEIESNVLQYAPEDITSINEDGQKTDMQDKQAARICDIEKEILEEDYTKTRTQDIEPAGVKINVNCMSVMKDMNVMRTKNDATVAGMNMNTSTVIAEVHRDFNGNTVKDHFKTLVTSSKGGNPRNLSIKGVRTVKIRYDSQMRTHCMNPGMGGFPCTDCGRRYNRPYLYTHMKQVHGREEWPCFKLGPRM